MSPEQIDLVQNSFNKIKPFESQVANLFYDRLFSIAPQVRPLFPDDLSKQKKMLMAVLETAVIGLGRLDKIKPALEVLGRRHIAYGVEPAQYTLFGDALLWTIERHLGKDFTLALKEAWTDAYAALSEAMIDAAGYRA